MLTDNLSILFQRTGLQNLLSKAGLALFQKAVIQDLSALFNIVNSVYRPVLSHFAEDLYDPMTYGVVGNNIYANTEATSASKSVFYSTEAGRKTTVTEAIDILLARIEALESP